MPFRIIDDDQAAPQQAGRFRILDDAESLAPPAAAPAPIGKDANERFLREELQNADPFTRNLAAAGTAVSDLWERAKQLVGKGDNDAIAANRIMREEAPAGAVVGQTALAALPFGLVGNGVKAATAVGAGMGFAKPVEGEQTLENIAKGTAKNVLLDAALSGAGQWGANKVGEYIAKRTADVALKNAVNAPRSQTLNEAIDAGLVVSPSDVKPSLLNTVVESIGGKAATAQAASNKNAEVFDGLARKALGLPKDAPLEPATLRAVRDSAYMQGYKPIANLPAVNGDHTFLQGVAKLSPASSGGAVKSPAQSQIGELMADLAGQAQWTGPQVIADIRRLRELARTNFRGDSAAVDLARAQIKGADLLEQLAERNVIQQGGNPGAVQAMRQARKKIAQAHDVEDALVEGGGTLDPRVLARKLQRGDKLSGEIQLIAKFANNFKRAAQPVQQIGGPGVSKLDMVMAGGGGAAGAVLGPLGSLAGAAAPFIAPRVARMASLSGPSQNALRDPLELWLAERMAGRLAKNAPIGLTVLGPEALSQ